MASKSLEDAHGGPAALQSPAHAALASRSSSDAQGLLLEEKPPSNAALPLGLQGDVWRAPADGQLPEGVAEQQEVEMTGGEPMPEPQQGSVMHADTGVPGEPTQDEAYAAGLGQLPAATV